MYLFVNCLTHRVEQQFKTIKNIAAKSKELGDKDVVNWSHFIPECRLYENWI